MKKLILEFPLNHWEDEIDHMSEEEAINFVLERENWMNIVWQSESRIEEEK